MSRAIPVLGYASKSEAVVALRGLGWTERQIADKLGIKPNTVTSLETKHRQRAAKRRQTVEVNVHHDLIREASRRQLTTDELVNRILRTVVQDKLFNAILD